jgi:hypothetical protein
MFPANSQPGWPEQTQDDQQTDGNDRVTPKSKDERRQLISIGKIPN